MTKKCSLIIIECYCKVLIFHKIIIINNQNISLVKEKLKVQKNLYIL